MKFSGNTSVLFHLKRIRTFLFSILVLCGANLQLPPANDLNPIVKVRHQLP